MQPKHLPNLGKRFWAGLCAASIFGANTGDFFAHNLGLGHVGGLPYLAVAFGLIVFAERFDRRAHETYYWLAIVVVRTAATNLADFMSSDMKLPRPIGMTCLTVILAALVIGAWAFWRKSAKGIGGPRTVVLRADAIYWACMLVAGTLGTVVGDYFSSNLHFGTALGSIALSGILAGFFIVGARGLIWVLPFYWATVVLVRAAGTCVGDFVAAHTPTGLALSTILTGIAFVGVLLLWREPKLIESSAN